MAYSQSSLSRQLTEALLASLEMHLEGLAAPAARRAALQEACGRINGHLSVAPLPSSGDGQWRHPALITAALYAAAQHLQEQPANV